MINESCQNHLTPSVICVVIRVDQAYLQDTRILGFTLMMTPIKEAGFFRVSLLVTGDKQEQEKP